MKFHVNEAQLLACVTKSLGEEREITDDLMHLFIDTLKSHLKQANYFEEIIVDYPLGITTCITDEWRQYYNYIEGIYLKRPRTPATVVLKQIHSLRQALPDNILDCTMEYFSLITKNLK